jgi:hypothetical protein
MKTDDLIRSLAAGAEAVDPQAPRRRLLAAAAAGIALAVPLMIGLLGVNPRLAQAATLPMFWVKLAFVAAVAAAAFAVALKLSRPGAPVRRTGVALAIPFAVMWLLAAAAIVVAAPGDRDALLFGSTWSACPMNIALLSAPVLLLSMWAMRAAAPTRPGMAGAAAGLLAGGLGATVYTLHCPELAAPFLGVWYVLGMSIPAAMGAAIGRSLLRW